MSKTKSTTNEADETPPQQEPTRETASMADVAMTEARVLVDCRYGRCNTLVTLDADTIRQGLAEHYLDTAPEAIAYLKATACPPTC